MYEVTMQVVNLYSRDIAMELNDIKWIIRYNIKSELTFMGLYTIYYDCSRTIVSQRRLYGSIDDQKKILWKLFSQFSKESLDVNAFTISFPKSDDDYANISIIQVNNTNAKPIYIYLDDAPTNNPDIRLFMLEYKSILMMETLTNQINELHEKNNKMNDMFNVLTDFIELVSGDTDKLKGIKTIIESHNV